jgi:hypothetical protein
MVTLRIPLLFAHNVTINVWLVSQMKQIVCLANQDHLEISQIFVIVTKVSTSTLPLNNKYAKNVTSGV